MESLLRDLIAMICLDRTTESDLFFPRGLPSLDLSKESPRQKKPALRVHACIAAFPVLGAALSIDARAYYWFTVRDASQIQYLVGSPQIYLRNLNSFDSTVLGCCYNYWIDVSADSGEATWSALLTKNADAAANMDLRHQRDSGAVIEVWFG